MAGIAVIALLVSLEPVLLSQPAPVHAVGRPLGSVVTVAADVSGLRPHRSGEDVRLGQAPGTSSPLWPVVLLPGRTETALRSPGVSVAEPPARVGPLALLDALVLNTAEPGASAEPSDGGIGEAPQPADTGTADSQVATPAASAAHPGVGDTGPAGFGSDPPPVPRGRQVVDAARRYLGLPYVWGGTTPRGFDCSGLVQYVYRQFGISLPRTSYEQVLVGQRVPVSDLRPGDLVYFVNTNGPGVSHVGIYAGNGLMVHAMNEQAGIVVTPVLTGYWGAHYYVARRVVTG